MPSTITEVTTDSGQRFPVALDARTNDPIIDCMRNGSLPTPDFLGFAQSLMQARGDQGIVIDLGCHLGMFSLPLAAAGFSILAIDANKKNTDLLEQTVLLNGWNNVQIVCGAVSDHAGRVGLMNDGPYGMVVEDHSGSLPCFMLDELVGSRPVSLIKIDIEGSEPKAIRGAARTLLQNKDIAVICESNRPLLEQVGSSPQELWGLLGTFGFDCYEFLGTKLMPRLAASSQERTVADFLAVKSRSFKLPPKYSIGEPTVDESVNMFLADVSYGHIVHVLRALETAPASILADPRIADILRRA